MQQTHKRFLLIAVTVLLFVLLEAWFFRGALPADKLIGDAGDSRLNNLIMEHWYSVFLGKASIANLPIFYPVAHTLSYTDLLFGFSLPYSLFRAVGVNMFLACKLTLMLFHSTGSAALYILLRKKMRFAHIPSIIGTVVCAYAGAYTIRSGHTQMFAFSLLPLLLIFLIGFFERLDKGFKQRLPYALSFIGMFAFMCCTGFYITYLSCLFLLTLVIAYAFLCKRRGGTPLRTVFAYLRSHLRELAAYAALLILAMIPFVLLYLPSFITFGARTWGEVSSYLPHPIDLVDVSPYNLAYGALFQNVSVASNEQYVGFPFLTLALFMAALILFARENARKAIPKGASFPAAAEEAGAGLPDTRFIQSRSLWLYACAVSVVLSMLLIIQLKDGFSLWYVMYRFLPGAGAMRAIIRYLFVLTLPVGLCIAGLCERAQQALRHKAHLKAGQTAAALLALCALLVFENSIRLDYMSNWTLSGAQQITSEVPAPPEDCTAMYLYRPAGGILTNMQHIFSQLDAWQIAQHCGIFTLNGYSGQFPHNWWGLWKVEDAGYLEAVNEWVNTYNLKNVYAYNIQTHAFVPHEQVMADAQTQGDTNP